MFGHQNFIYCRQGSNLSHLVPEADTLSTALPVPLTPLAKHLNGWPESQISFSGKKVEAWNQNQYILLMTCQHTFIHRDQQVRGLVPRSDQ